MASHYSVEHRFAVLAQPGVEDRAGRVAFGLNSRAGMFPELRPDISAIGWGRRQAGGGRRSYVRLRVFYPLTASDAWLRARTDALSAELGSVTRRRIVPDASDELPAEYVAALGL